MRLFIAGMVYFMISCSFLSGKDKSTAGSRILIHISGYRSIQGNIKLNIFTNRSGFPDDYNKAYYFITWPVKKAQEVVVISNINPGQYSISVFHDENSNKIMDKNFLGIPEEVYGFSNNVRGTYGPPDFKDTVFSVDKPEIKIFIKLK